MRVCVVSRSLKTHRIGGMENHIDVLTRGLSREGHEVTILTTSHPEGIPSEESQGIEIEYLANTEPGVYSEGWWINSNRRIDEMIESGNVDMFHSQSIAVFSSLGSIGRKNKALVTTSHGTPITDAESYWRTARLRTSPIGVGKMMFYLPHHRKVYRSSRKVIAVSDQLREHIARWNIAPSSNVTTIPNGIDLKKFRPDLDTSNLRERLGLEGEKILLFIGRITKEKGVEIALKALKSLSEKVGDIKLIVVGEGDFQEKVIPAARSLGVERNVLLVGRIDEEDVPFFHNLADVYIIPSTRWEALPLSLLEAMASGSVVVASNVGGIPSVVVDGQNGILVDKGDSESLANGCLTALSSPVKHISENARRTAEERFDERTMVKKVIAVYEEALARF